MSIDRLSQIPPASLGRCLREDYEGGNGGALSRFINWIQSDGDGTRNLYVLIEAGRLPEAIRAEMTQHLHFYGALSLFGKPEYEHIRDYGPFLVAHPGGNSVLLNTFARYNSDVVSAWIVSKLKIEPLVAHLRQVMHARGPDRRTPQLVRWYDPLTVSTLIQLADPAWSNWFLSPITSLWYPVDTPQKETWSRISGRDEATAPAPMKLVLNEELWEAMVNDPLPYHILDIAVERFPSAFESDCYGVRLAKIEEMLKAAREQGLERQDDLVIYVLTLLNTPARAWDADWQAALQRAAAGEAPLRAYFTA